MLHNQTVLSVTLCGTSVVSLCYKMQFRIVTQRVTEKAQRTTENKFNDVAKGLYDEKCWRGTVEQFKMVKY